MKNICFIITLSLISFSCKKNQEKEYTQSNTKKSTIIVTDTTNIDGVLLELINDNGKAKLKINTKEYKLSGDIKINPPCYFLRWEKNKVENFSYPDVGVKHTLVILGNMATKDDRKTFGAENSDNICGTGMQGILFKKDSIIVTNKILTHSFVCADIGTDEKDFSGFAHD
ncbi:hypothetical protein [Chryseobacterium sp. BIGb0232]|uniref:hypothetical protein n=1 Tax=Chryseobacterium sp. BIGb0232 TaxID=2940598 RepID=UPI000F49414F|nr:hypothetical protein [Chryseobacterium sp. BIGb0232]MCS4302804.1 hypothetical protein [Chryseobacterium sp. BIGb0232]ROS17456.1 hypothetical protein EDF65_1826 [Chryseobacterium nakagawai]